MTVSAGNKSQIQNLSLKLALKLEHKPALNIGITQNTHGKPWLKRAKNMVVAEARQAITKHNIILYVEPTNKTYAGYYIETNRGIIRIYKMILETYLRVS